MAVYYTWHWVARKARLLWWDQTHMTRRVVADYENLSVFPSHVAVELHKPLGEQVAGHPSFGVVPVAYKHVIFEVLWLPGLPNDKGQPLIAAVD